MFDQVLGYPGLANSIHKIIHPSMYGFLDAQNVDMAGWLKGSMNDVRMIGHVLGMMESTLLVVCWGG